MAKLQESCRLSGIEAISSGSRMTAIEENLDRPVLPISARWPIVSHRRETAREPWSAASFAGLRWASGRIRRSSRLCPHLQGSQAYVGAHS